MARKEGKKAKGAGARALASVAVTLRVTTTPAALNAPLQGASHSPFRLRNCWEGRSVRASSLLRACDQQRLIDQVEGALYEVKPDASIPDDDTELLRDYVKKLLKHPRQ